MKWFLDEVAPLLRAAEVDVYSAQWPFASAPDRVHPRSGLPHFADYGLFVAPIRNGSGMRIKLLEAMARGKAVVTTPLGAEGLGTREFASALEALSTNSPRRVQIGRAAAEHARAHFADPHVAERIAKELATFAP
jgi:glycosyltransferase involved in cell wall biosynthesis